MSDTQLTSTATILHDGTRIACGETITLPESDAVRLIALGVAERAAETPPKTATP